MTSADDAAELRRRRSTDWAAFLRADETVTGRFDSIPRAFDRKGVFIDTSAGIRCATRERDWLEGALVITNGETVSTAQGILSRDAIQEVGIPSKLFVSYLGRLLLVPVADDTYRLTTCYTGALGRVGPALRR